MLKTSYPWFVQEGEREQVSSRKLGSLLPTPACPSHRQQDLVRLAPSASALPLAKTAAAVMVGGESAWLDSGSPVWDADRWALYDCEERKVNLILFLGGS